MDRWYAGALGGAVMGLGPISAGVHPVVIGADFIAAGLAVYVAVYLRLRLPWVAWVLPATIAAGALLSGHPESLVFAGRVLILTFIGAWVVRSGDMAWFAGALALTAVVSIMLILPGLVTDPTTRQYGAYRHISIAGTGGFALAVVGFMVRPVSWPAMVAGGLLVVATVTRAPAVALLPLLTPLAWAVRNHPVGFFLGAGATAAFAVMVVRLEPAQVITSFETRAATAFDIGDDPLAELCATPQRINGPEYVCKYGEYSVFGTGAAGYLDRFTWPRPHNVYSIMAFEYGVLAVIPAGLFLWLILSRRLPIRVAGAILILGLLDDGLISQRESPYLCAIILVAAWRDCGKIQLRRHTLKLPTHNGNRRRSGSFGAGYGS